MQHAPVVVACGLICAASTLVLVPALYRAVRDVARARRRDSRRVHPIAPERYERALRDAHDDKLRRERERVERERGER